MDAMMQTSTAPKGYVIQKLLGIGQTANVYLAQHPHYGHVALKMFRPGAKDNYTLRQMFSNEVQITRRLKHPCIIHAFDGKATEPGAYLVVEYCSQGTLDRVVSTVREVPLEHLYRIIVQVASGLMFCHERGILHRDVKPANVFIAQDNKVKLGDLGTAVYAAEMPEDRVGTAYYMAPELFQGTKATVYSDIYALGVLAYEVITGTRPFQGSTQEAIMTAHLMTPPQNPQRLRPDLPRGVALVLKRAIARDPKQRIQTVRAFREAFLKATALDTSTMHVESEEDQSKQFGRTSRTGHTTHHDMSMHKTQVPKTASEHKDKEDKGLWGRLFGRKR